MLSLSPIAARRQGMCESAPAAMIALYALYAGVRMGKKKTETISLRADLEFCGDLDEARGSRTRSAFLRELAESGLRLRALSLKPRVWVGARRDLPRNVSAVLPDRPAP